jgi:methionyl-tRNA formyltransferase
LKIIFAGTPEFAAEALGALLAKQYDVVAVLTQPDRPAGRGMQLNPSPVKQLAEQRGIKVLQPHNLKSAEVQQQLAEFKADVMVVAAYGLILPISVLQMPRYGCLNIHASLLPRWRGAAPVQRAILAGDKETGITIMQMDAGLDTGDMLLKKTCQIAPSDTAQTLLDKLSKLGAESIVEVLQRLQHGSLLAEPQDPAQASYASKLNKSEAQLNWTQSAVQLESAVRGYNPFPVAYSTFHNIPVKIWRSTKVDDISGEPGIVLAIDTRGVVVACGQGALGLEVMQRPNGKALPFKQFLQGFPIKVGDRFDMH